MLVWGIGGGVATAAFQIAKALGARVIVTSSSDAKLERASELGADVTVNHESGDVMAAVIEATGGRGVDVVVEHVGEATWRTSQDVASQGGRIVVCGATTGPNPPARCTASGGRSSPSSARRWGRRRTSRRPTSLVEPAREVVVDSTFPLPRPAPRTSGWRQASSSGRSCCIPGFLDRRSA